MYFHTNFSAGESLTPPGGTPDLFSPNMFSPGKNKDISSFIYITTAFLVAFIFTYFIIDTIDIKNII